MDKTVEIRIIPVKHQLVIGVLTTIGGIVVNKLVQKGYDAYIESNDKDKTED